MEGSYPSKDEKSALEREAYHTAQVIEPYDIEVLVSQQCFSTPAVPHPPYQPGELVFHAKMYIIADLYDVPALKTYAAQEYVRAAKCSGALRAKTSLTRPSWSSRRSWAMKMSH